MTATVDRDAFLRDGFCIVPGVLTADEAVAIRGSLRDRFPDLRGPRAQDLWRRNRHVRALATDPVVLDVLKTLYERRPIPFQTLNFVEGTQQPLHSDSVHFDGIPSGHMCGVWVALEDIGPDQGPVTYVPGSHLQPLPADIGRADGAGFDNDAYERAVAERFDGSGSKAFSVSAGDALIWAGELVHGGSPRRPGTTRWSQVTHYFFEGCTYITPQRSDMVSGELFVRDPLVDISTGRRVTHCVDGGPARFERLPNGRARILVHGEQLTPRRRMASDMRGWARGIRSGLAAIRS